MVKRDRNRRPKRKVCSFCADKIEHIDYKDVAKLRRFIEPATSLFYRSQLNNKANIKTDTFLYRFLFCHCW